MDYIVNTLSNLLQQTAFLNLTTGNLIMIAVACFFLYLAIGKGFEPLLLVPISFGMLLVNIYPDIMIHAEDSANGVGGLLWYFYLLDEWSILPSLIFMGVGAIRSAYREPEELPLRCGCSVRYLRCLLYGYFHGLQRQGCCSYLHHRWC